MSDVSDMRMDAYYYGFEKTGNEAIDRILSAVACAGKAFHHTEQWGEDVEWLRSDYLEGNSCVEWIQNAANAAAKRLTELEGEKEDLRQRFDLEVNQQVDMATRDYVARLAVLEEEKEALREQTVQREYERLLESGLDGLSHEDGWTLTKTTTLDTLKAVRDATSIIIHRLKLSVANPCWHTRQDVADAIKKYEAALTPAGKEGQDG